MALLSTVIILIEDKCSHSDLLLYNYNPKYFESTDSIKSQEKLKNS